jgi:hypothetical protein
MPRQNSTNHCIRLKPSNQKIIPNQGPRPRPNHSPNDPGATPWWTKNLLQLYNAILRLEYWPMEFKTARVIMIRKPGKRPTDVTSYRPISLLQIISKILEKLLLCRLLSDTHSQDWIPSHQFGFRKAHSTIQQCHRLTTIINETLENHQYCSAAFPDVSQAFDKV